MSALVKTGIRFETCFRKPFRSELMQMLLGRSQEGAREAEDVGGSRWEPQSHGPMEERARGPQGASRGTGCGQVRWGGESGEPPAAGKLAGAEGGGGGQAWR